MNQICLWNGRITEHAHIYGHTGQGTPASRSHHRKMVASSHSEQCSPSKLVPAMHLKSFCFLDLRQVKDKRETRTQERITIKRDVSDIKWHGNQTDKPMVKANHAESKWLWRESETGHKTRSLDVYLRNASLANSRIQSCLTWWSPVWVRHTFMVDVQLMSQNYGKATWVCGHVDLNHEPDFSCSNRALYNTCRSYITSCYCRLWYSVYQWLIVHRICNIQNHALLTPAASVCVCTFKSI